MTIKYPVEATRGNNEQARGKTQGKHRRSGGVAVLLSVAAIALAACSGGTHTAHVASLPATGSRTNTSSGTATGSGGGGPATTAPRANPTQLLDEWAACMRAHGDAGQADPTIDSNKVIHITWDPSVPGGLYGTNKGGQGNVGPGQYCRSFLNDAQTELQGGQARKQPTQAQLVAFSECMRANGIPDFPDPTGNGDLSINLGAGGDLNPTNPAFQTASKLCAQRTGVQGFTSGATQPGMIELNGSGPGLTGG